MDNLLIGLVIIGFDVNGSGVIDNNDGIYIVLSLVLGVLVIFIIEIIINVNFQGISLMNVVEIILDEGDDIDFIFDNNIFVEDDQDEVMIIIN